MIYAKSVSQTDCRREKKRKSAVALSSARGANQNRTTAYIPFSVRTAGAGDTRCERRPPRARPRPDPPRPWVVWKACAPAQPARPRPSPRPSPRRPRRRLCGSEPCGAVGATRRRKSLPARRAVSAGREGNEKEKEKKGGEGKRRMSACVGVANSSTNTFDKTDALS